MLRYIFIFQRVIIAVIFVLGLINAIKPRFLWEKFESWKAKEEPSSAYFMVRRIAGIFVMIVALMMFFPYLMNPLN